MASRTSLLVVAIAVALASLAGCGGSAKVKAGQIAVACGEPVTQAQFDSLIAEGEAAYKLRKTPFPAVGSSKYEALKQKVVQLLVEHAEQTEEGRKMGIRITDAQVDQNLSQLVQSQFKGDRKAFAAAVAKQGLTVAQITDSIRSNLLQKAISDKVTAKLKVHDAEIKAYYEQNKAQYKSRPQRQIREIVVKTKAEAQKVIAQLDAGTDFAALAKKLSLDPNAKQTGGLQLLQQGTMATSDDASVFALPVGRISGAVRVGPSWAVVKAVGAVQPAHQVPLAQVRLPIVQFLLGEKRKTAVTSWMDGVKKRCAGGAAYAKGYAPPKSA